jgi:hypothetical protein
VPDNGFMIKPKLRVISGFRRGVAENCDLLGYNAASSGNFPYHYSPRNNREERSSKPKHVARFRHYKYCLKMLDVTDDVTFCSIRLSRQQDVPLYDTKLKFCLLCLSSKV